MSAPDLSALDRDNAEFVAACMGRAIVAFQIEVENAKLRLKMSHPGSRYEAEALWEVRKWNTDMARARAFQEAARNVALRAMRRSKAA